MASKSAQSKPKKLAKKTKVLLSNSQRKKAIDAAKILHESISFMEKYHRGGCDSSSPYQLDFDLRLSRERKEYNCDAIDIMRNDIITATENMQTIFDSAYGNPDLEIFLAQSIACALRNVKLIAEANKSNDPSHSVSVPTKEKR